MHHMMLTVLNCICNIVRFGVLAQSFYSSKTYRGLGEATARRAASRRAWHMPGRMADNPPVPLLLPCRLVGGLLWARQYKAGEGESKPVSAWLTDPCLYYL
eukprot:1154329-Pelagomonas_calceolata.AAC.3